MTSTSSRIEPPPREFDAFVAWLVQFGDHLVLLEEYPLYAIRKATDDARRRILDHVRSDDGMFGPSGGTDEARVMLRELIRSDHRWFLTSLEELDGLVRVFEREDHGGHRQALGQYLRLIAAALERHRKDELVLVHSPPSIEDEPLRNAN